MAKKKKAVKTADDNLSVEDAMTELQAIVDALESGQDPLDESLSKYERGMALLRSCHLQLDSAAQRIEIVTGADADGTMVTEEFDSSATGKAAPSTPQRSKTAEERLEEEADRLF